MLGTQQSFFLFLKKHYFAECRRPNTRQSFSLFKKNITLPSALGPALDKDFFSFLFKKHTLPSAPCPGTRQRPRELQFFLFFLHSTITDKYDIDITNMHYISKAHA
jgi:hypothetical protein